MNPNVVYPTIQAAKLSKGTTLKLPNVHDASKRSFFKVTVGDRRHARADQHSEVYEARYESERRCMRFFCVLPTFSVHDRTTGKICGVVKCIFPHNIFNGISEEMKRSERRGIQLGLWAARHNISRVTKYMSVLEDTEQFKYIVLMPFYPHNLKQIAEGNGSPLRDSSKNKFVIASMYSTLQALSVVQAIPSSALETRTPIAETAKSMIPSDTKEHGLIIMKDIKCSNLLVDADKGALVLNDFGSTDVLFGNAQADPNPCITQGHAPIELSHGRILTSSCDIFATGIMGLELANAGITPRVSDLSQLLENVQKGFRGSELVDFYRIVLSPEGMNLTANKALAHPVFSHLSPESCDKYLKDAFATCILETSYPSVPQALESSTYMPLGSASSMELYARSLRREWSSNIAFFNPDYADSERVAKRRKILSASTDSQEPENAPKPPNLDRSNSIMPATGRSMDIATLIMVPKPARGERVYDHLKHLLFDGSTINFNKLNEFNATYLQISTSGPTISLTAQEVCDFFTAPTHTGVESLGNLLAAYLDRTEPWPLTMIALEQKKIMPKKPIEGRIPVKLLLGAKIITLGEEQSVAKLYS